MKYAFTHEVKCGQSESFQTYYAIGHTREDKEPDGVVE